MVLPPPDLLNPALLGSHSTEPTAVAVVFIALAIGLRFLRFRTRGRRGGPWGGGPTGGGGRGGTPDNATTHWDIRKPVQGPAQQGDGAVSEEQNPPSDL